MVLRDGAQKDSVRRTIFGGKSSGDMDDCDVSERVEETDRRRDLLDEGTNAESTLELLELRVDELGVEVLRVREAGAKIDWGGMM